MTSAASNRGNCPECGSHYHHEQLSFTDGIPANTGSAVQSGPRRVVNVPFAVALIAFLVFVRPRVDVLTLAFYTAIVVVPIAFRYLQRQSLHAPKVLMFLRT
jgi:hypothetical protein